MTPRRDIRSAAGTPNTSSSSGARHPRALRIADDDPKKRATLRHAQSRSIARRAVATLSRRGA